MRLNNITTGVQVLISAALFFFVAVHVSAVSAGTLSFDPSSINTRVGESFTLTVKVDVGTAEVLGVDALIQYDKDMFEVTGFTDGTFLSVGAKEPGSDGKAYVAGMVESAGESVTGSGELVDITFKAKESGTSTISFICELGETGESNISENSTDATDLIECSQNGEAVVVVSGGSTSDGGGGSTSGGGSGSTPSTLPKTGFYEDMVLFGIIAGGALVLVGLGTRFLSS